MTQKFKLNILNIIFKILEAFLYTTRNKVTGIK